MAAPVKYRWPLPEVRIVAIYFVVASLWIVGSDLILTKSSVNETQAGIIQSLKGLNFVITTAILLYFVLRRAYGGWRMAERQRLVVLEHAREKFRKLSSHIQTLREDERTSIAREIHDELGQLLTSIKMEIRLVEIRLTDRDDRALNPLIDKLVEASELVDNTIEAVQRISSGLRPSTLDNIGLGTALINEAVLFSDRSGIPCSIIIEDLPDPLPPAVTTTTFRIFQEALTNIARHADARHIDARITAANDILEFTIHDDGKGIDPAALDDPKSLGLVGMLERADNVGGTVVFSRNAEKGTDVVLTVPLRTSENVILGSS